MGHTVILELKTGTPSWHLPVIPGQWKRTGDDRIVATYSRYELALALAAIGNPVGVRELARIWEAEGSQ